VVAATRGVRAVARQCARSVQTAVAPAATSPTTRVACRRKPLSWSVDKASKEFVTVTMELLPNCHGARETRSRVDVVCPYQRSCCALPPLRAVGFRRRVFPRYLEFDAEVVAQLDELEGARQVRAGAEAPEVLVDAKGCSTLRA
jgi:hypothetical protein